ncbi:hypothetical protein B0H13DRAFT_2381265 [Mycena leptocephala]|nr:hypothetical protein B0H13DRAFT_2381265 [Mycena leptocephala]
MMWRRSFRFPNARCSLRYLDPPDLFFSVLHATGPLSSTDRGGARTTRPAGLRTPPLRPSLADPCATSVRNAPGGTKDGTMRVREFPHRWVWSLHARDAGAGEAR